MTTSEQAPTGRRDTKGRFAKGASGNAGGRPKEYRAFRDRCTEFMDAEGFDQLVVLAQSGELDALRLIAEYAYGKPTKHIDVNARGSVTIYLPERKP